MEHGFCPLSWQRLWCSSLHFIGNKHTSTRAVSSCWREAISWDLVRCWFTSFGIRTFTWGEERVSSFGRRTFPSVSPIFTGHGKRFGQCCRRTCLESALTLHRISYSIARYSYLPKPLYSSWALPCFCGTGVIRPRFSYLPPGWASCSWAERWWHIRTACHL